MPDTLTARLLAEIERRERGHVELLGCAASRCDTLAYLAALRKIVEIHEPTEVRVYAAGPADTDDWMSSGPTGPYAIELDCRACDGCLEWPCPTIVAVAAGLGVAL